MNTNLTIEEFAEFFMRDEGKWPKFQPTPLIPIFYLTISS
jgi:hypothetical protein